MEINQKFWNKFYLEKKEIKIPKPSSFGIFFNKKFVKKNNKVLEIGCGNGRDAFLFSKKAKKIIALDKSKNAIKINLLVSKKFRKKIIFLNKDFIEIYKIKRIEFDILYARFFLHTINYKQENELFKLINFLKKKHKFIVGMEFRTSKDALIKKGKYINKNTRFTDHYRRFISVPKFLKKIKKNNFEILYIKQGINLSKTENENPNLCRLIFKV